MSSQPVPALLPLSLLEAIQNIDTPPDDGLGALEQELAAKRLGLSPTVAAQVARYRQQVRSGGDVGDGEAEAVFKLVGRRTDAALVYSDGGRRAARYAAGRIGSGSGLAIRAAPRRLAQALTLRHAARLARRWLLLPVSVSEGTLRCTTVDALTIRARDDGLACQFYTAALAELPRRIGGLDWTADHEQCSGRDDRQCLWRVRRAEDYE